jgi:hypothetical protein
MSNAEQLRQLIRQHSLSRARAAELCGKVSIHTLNAWLLPRGAKAWRNMPDGKLRLLQLEVAALPATK